MKYCVHGGGQGVLSLCVLFTRFFFFFLADLGSGFCDQELGVKLPEKRELRLCSGRTERRAARRGARLLGGLRRRPWTAAPLAEAAAIAPPSIPHSTGGTCEQGSPSPPAPQPPQPVRPAPPRAMAKEGVEKAEETEQMIEKEAGKEPAEGGGGGGSHRLGDAQEMRAVVLAGFGGLNKLRVTRKAMPEPQDGELKIRVKAWSSIRAFLAFFLSLFARSELRGSGWQSLGGHAARGEEPPWAAPRAPSPALRAFPAAPWPADAGKEAGRQALGALPKPDLGVTGGDGELREGKGGRWRPALRVWLIAPRELSVEQDSSGARRGRFDGNMVRKP